MPKIRSNAIRNPPELANGRYPRFASAVRPRTRAGRRGAILFLLLFALVQPPLVFLLANRITPWVLGLPFLYAYLLLIYLALIGVLLWALKRGL
jgi:hypothetical protein